MNSSLKSVAVDGRPSAWRWRAGTARSKRPLLAMTMRSVRSRSTGLPGRWKEPQAHDLTPEEQAQAVLKDVRDVGGQRPVWPPAQIGHVHGDAAAGLQLLDGLG